LSWTGEQIAFINILNILAADEFRELEMQTAKEAVSALSFNETETH
jgi:hypothetical protein